MLKIVHISVVETEKPRRLTAKQRREMEVDLMIAEQRRKDRRAAEKMTDRLKTLIK